MLGDTAILVVGIAGDIDAGRSMIFCYEGARQTGELAEIIREDDQGPLPDDTSWLINRGRIFGDSDGFGVIDFSLTSPDFVDMTSAPEGKN